jgi:hypothetical protein
MRRTLLLACVVLSCGLPYALADEEPKAAEPKAADAKAGRAKVGVAITTERLMAHVTWLAAPERRGRGTWPDREATANYIAAAFRKAGLQTLPGHDSMFFDKAGLKEPALRNVAAWLPGPAGAQGEYVILSAHYDHLGQKVTEIKDGETVMRTTMTFHGADDNASGVAALLEIARSLALRHKADPKAFPRGLVFVAFDLEERNLLGSKHYVAEPPLPLAGCAAFVTLDMLGRSIADLVPGSLFVMGMENSAVLEGHVRAVGEPKGGRSIRMGIDFQPGYSDYVPFKDAKIPYLFLTSGACEDYHRTGDITARIKPTHLLARTRYARALTTRILAGPTRPVWRDGVPPSVEEIKSLRALMATIEASLKTVPGLPPMVSMLVGNYGIYLDKVLVDEKVTPEERKSVRLGALNLFRMAQQFVAPAAGGR